MRTLRVLVLTALLGNGVTGCGADDAGTSPPAAPSSAEPETPAPEPDVEPAPEPSAAADPEPAPPPEPAPIDVEPGTRLGPIRIGMTEEELAALELEVTEVDPRTRSFGPYRVQRDDGVVDQVEAYLGDLGRVRIGDEVLDTTRHIHDFRDRLGDCVWQEGGGERYRCRDGHLWVETTHSMSPERYAIRVE